MRAVRWLFGSIGTLLLAGLVYAPHTLRGAPLPPVFPPQRIVSLTLATDEMLLALVRPERIRALTIWADDPLSSNVVTEAGRIPHRVGANAEQVIAHQPDLILVAPYTAAAVTNLLKAGGSPLHVLQSYDSIAEIQRNIIAVGRAVGEQPRAETLVADMNRRLAAVEEQLRGFPQPAVLYYMPGGFTAGRHTTIDEMLTRAGGRNVAAAAGIWRFKRISQERLVTLNPRIILVGGNPHESQAESVRTLLLADPALQTIDAVNTRRVYVLPYTTLTTVSHYIAQSVEHVARILHPHAFQYENVTAQRRDEQCHETKKFVPNPRGW